MPFHNTISVDDKTLALYSLKAKTQEERIYKFFKQYPGWQFTPFDVQKALDLYHVPITSIRRAITDLTRQGKLVKCSEQKKGPYGKPNNTWKLLTAEPAPQLNIFNEQETN